jgi:hypothetical protein
VKERGAEEADRRQREDPNEEKIFRGRFLERNERHHPLSFAWALRGAVFNRANGDAASGTLPLGRTLPRAYANSRASVSGKAY